jgi:hypothetical protein
MPIVRADATNPPRRVIRLIVSLVERLRGDIGDIVENLWFFVSSKLSMGCCWPLVGRAGEEEEEEEEERELG